MPSKPVPKRRPNPRLSNPIYDTPLEVPGLFNPRWWRLVLSQYRWRASAWWHRR